MSWSSALTRKRGVCPWLILRVAASHLVARDRMMFKPTNEEVGVSVQKLVFVFAVSCCMVFTVPVFASAGPMHALAAIAHKYGYGYRVLGPENAVELSKPGLSVIICPGTRLYSVNGTPDAADIAPALRHRDIYVSSETVSTLGRIAQAAPSSQQGPVTIGVAGNEGSETIRVSGTAPPNSPVGIALYAQISRDLPTVFVNASRTVASSAGTYLMNVPIGPDYYRGSTLVVRATSTSGATASTTYVIGAPNPGIFAPTRTQSQIRN